VLGHAAALHAFKQAHLRLATRQAMHSCARNPYEIDAGEAFHDPDGYDLDAKWAPTELASTNFIRVVYHSLADKGEAKKTLLKRILHRS
jgi:hypothetical protein